MRLNLMSVTESRGRLDLEPRVLFASHGRPGQ